MRIKLGDLRRMIREALRVSTKTGASDIPEAGIGLFADEDIEVGQTIFSWDPSVDSEYPLDHPDHLSPKDSKEFKALASLDDDGWVMAGDGAAHINHSSDPNVGLAPGSGRSAKRDRIAIKNIRAGEEILMDYGDIGIDM